MIKKILSFLLMLFFAQVVFAGNIQTVSYYNETGHQVNHVQMIVYSCANNEKSCNDVVQPPLFNQNSGELNYLVVEYPETSYYAYYGKYVYANGYLPKAYSVTSYSTGGVFTQDITFNKGQNCRSPIDSFSMTNSVYANEPIVVNVNVAVDATTYSAFHDAGIPPYYVPEGYVNFYSAETLVIFEVYNPSGQLVYNDSTIVNVYMDTSQEVYFNWTPTVEGEGYRALVRTSVIDDQCASTTEFESTKLFNVLPTRSTNEYYLLLNNLEIANISAIFETDSEIDFRYDKVSNEVDDSDPRNYKELPFTAIYRVYDKNTSSLQAQSTEPISIKGSTDAVTINSYFDISTLNTGLYYLKVTGQFNSSDITPGYTLANIDTITVDFEIRAIPTYSFIFTIADAETTDKIPDVNITVTPIDTIMDPGVKTGTTNSSGMAIISGEYEGTYEYELSHPDYDAYTGTGLIGNVDTEIFINMYSNNVAPDIYLNNINPYRIKVGETKTVDFGSYVSDGNNADSELRLEVTEVNTINVGINGLEVTFSSSQIGTDDMIFWVFDPRDAFDSDNLQVIVTECNPGEEETVSCYEGPEGTQGVGLCSAGTQTRICGSEGQWGPWGSCVGAIYPAEEICDGLDNDCDGIVDNGGDTLCDDGLWCNGLETCEGFEGCQAGIAVDCSDYNIAGVATCNYCDPNPFTWDYRAEFISTCDEDTDSCTVGDDTITHECSVDNCEAECDATHSCSDTECDDLDGCVGNDYYDYDDVANTCEEDCTCTNNQCGEPTIYYNDPRCTECQTDDDCNHLDNDYCECNYKVMHDEGRCINHECIVETTLVQDCNDLDEYYCDNTNIMYDNYWCVDAECVLKSTDFIEDCGDGLFCNGQETCENAECIAGTPIDCSANNIPRVATCDFCDPNPYTWDYRAEFISTCDEDTDSCTVGDDTITHECSVDNCEAECDATHSCSDTECDDLDGCVGNDYYDYDDIANTCEEDCTCTNNQCGEPTITHNDPRCFACTPGEQETISCYEGPEGTEGIGICTAGTKTKTCDLEGQWGSWGPCEGAVYPAEEICDGLDNDCDGLIDEDGVCDTPPTDDKSVLGMTRFSIINDDYLRPGDSIVILATLENNGNINLNDIRLTLVVPELDMRRRIGPFDLKKNEEITKLVILDIPYWAEPGYYNIRATASNGDVRRVKHREIIIHN